MHNCIFEYLKVIAKHLVIAFLIVSSLIFIIYIIFGKTIEKDIYLINKMFVFNNSYKSRDKRIELDKVEKKLIEYPSYGDVIGSLSIPSINIEVTLYHGESLKILKYGLGHHAGTYFPGEGGTIVIAGHNTYGVFYDLPKINIGDKINIKTSYGEYTYIVDRTNIDNDNDIKLNINKDKEKLMKYTCYPVDIPGYKSKRFIVYASLEGDTF